MRDFLWWEKSCQMSPPFFSFFLAPPRRHPGEFGIIPNFSFLFPFYCPRPAGAQNSSEKLMNSSFRFLSPAPAPPAPRIVRNKSERFLLFPSSLPRPASTQNSSEQFWTFARFIENIMFCRSRFESLLFTSIEKWNYHSCFRECVRKQMLDI